jgi:hypothetical protein
MPKQAMRIEKTDYYNVPPMDGIHIPHKTIQKIKTVKKDNDMESNQQTRTPRTSWK